MVAVIATVLVVPATADSHEPGCTTKACDKRVAKKIHWTAVGATTYGGPHDRGTPGHTGYRGANLDVLWKSWAELANFCALGCLPNGTKIRVLVPSTGKKLTLTKRDVGGGGGPIGGLPRAIDLWWKAAVALDVGPVWSGRVLYRRLLQPRHAGPPHGAPTRLRPPAERPGGVRRSQGFLAVLRRPVVFVVELMVPLLVTLFVVVRFIPSNVSFLYVELTR